MSTVDDITVSVDAFVTGPDPAPTRMDARRHARGSTEKGAR
jgi:hypothetical protein